MRRIAVALAAATLAGIVVASGASAQDEAGDDDADDQVVLTGRLVVPEGETVAHAVIFNGRATIDGAVTQSLVVFNGRTEITGTVGEDVIVFNGRVVVRSGARVGGDVLSRQSAEIEDGATIGGDVRGISGRFDVDELWFWGRLPWWVAYSVSTLVLGLLLLLFAPAVDGAIVDVLRRRTGAAIGFGVAVFFLVPIVAVILLVLIVTIPLSLFVLLALALLYTIGYVAGAHAVGRLLVKPPASGYVAFLAGLGILRLLALIPIVGGLVWLLASIFGLGLLTLAARRRPPVPAVVAPPPPAPTTA